MRVKLSNEIKKLKLRLSQFFIIAIKHFNNRRWTYLRFLLIFAPALWLNYTVFDNNVLPIENLTRETDDANTTYLLISTTPTNFPRSEIKREELTPSDLTAIFWKISMKMPEEKVCFKNRGTYLEYNNQKDYENIGVKLSFNKGEFEVVKVNEELCKTLYKGDDKFTFNWRFSPILVFPTMLLEEPEYVPINETSPTNETYYLKQVAKIRLHPDVESYIKPSPISQVLKFIIIFFSTGTLVWTCSRTFVFIRDGLS